MKPLSGISSPSEGSTTARFASETFSVLGSAATGEVLCSSRPPNYKFPVIIYKKVTSEQIHEVFSLYNKQGKHLNAEEIRNALYHHLAS